MRKAIVVSGAETLSNEVRRDLIELVFADSQTMVLGAIMTIFSGLIIATLAHSWPAVGASAMIALVVVVRIRLKWIYKSRTRGNAFTDVRWLERHYLVGMIAYLLSVGLLAVAAFAASNNSFVLILAVSSAVTHALSIAVRNYAIRTGVGLQLSAVAIPLGAAFLLKGGLFPLLILLLLAPLCFFIYGSASRLRSILLSQIAFRSESEHIANQFDFAINNMSHGMCMVSAEKRILVSNAKFSEFLALEHAAASQQCPAGSSDASCKAARGRAAGGHRRTSQGPRCGVSDRALAVAGVRNREPVVLRGYDHPKFPGRMGRGGSGRDGEKKR